MADPLAPTVPTPPGDHAPGEATRLPELAPGSAIGRYRVVSYLGGGGMGHVYQARDMTLDRLVAIKVVRPASRDARAQQRLVDEARAMAKLEHPSVLPVFDVGEFDGGIYVAMHFATGGTLHSWLYAEPRPWRDVVAKFISVGRGLASAHSAGVVHRDVKPRNILIGESGAVMLADFGIASGLAPETEADATRIYGTPGYMAPEQAAGRTVDARSDQYAFCISLWEGIHGERPQEAETRTQRLPWVNGSNAPQTRRRVPNWLTTALARGVSAQPERRWPSMTALLDSLERGMGRRRRLLATAAVVGMAALGAVVVWRARNSSSASLPSCDGGPREMLLAWGPDQRSRVAWHLAALPGDYARDVAPTLLGQLDRYAERWVGLHTDACLAHVRGELPTPAYDRRTACLSRARSALKTASGLATVAPSEGLPSLVTAASTLPALSDCEDDDRLATPVAPPPVGSALAVAATAELLARVDTETQAAEYDAARKHAAQAIAQAQSLAYPPLLAQALLAQGRVDVMLATGSRGADVLREATKVALAAGDDRLAIEAFALSVFAIATTSGPEEALASAAFFEALATRLSEKGRRERGILFRALGSAAMARGARDEARGLFDHALKELAGGDGDSPLQETTALFGLMLVVPDPVLQAQLGHELIQKRTSLLGATHPWTMEARVVVAGLAMDPAVAYTAMMGPCTDLARVHPGHAGRIAECSFELLILALAMDDSVGLRRAIKQISDTASHGGERDYVAVAHAIELHLAGDSRGALLALERERVPITSQSPWWTIQGNAQIDLLAAHVRLAIGDRQPAAVNLASAKRALDAIAGKMPPSLLAFRRALMVRLQRQAAPFMR